MTIDTYDHPQINEELTFEQALAQLNALVQKLESGQLPLEESVAAFELGVKLSRHCEGLLDQAEQRLSVLDERLADNDGTKEQQGR